MANSNPPSHEQLKKDLKKDAENTKNRAAADAKELKDQGQAKAQELKKEGKAKAQEVKKASEEEAEDLKEASKELYEAARERGEVIYDAAQEKGHEALEATRKELDRLEEEGRTLFSKLSASIQRGANQFGQFLQRSSQNIQAGVSQAASRTAIELQNPVVVTQLFVIAGGAAAGYLGWIERYRIRSDHNLVVGIHASVITGLVLLDGFLFNKYYPQYDKKRTTVRK
ncbi:putative integral membrane protein [Candida parapsilosis]|uniref:Mitochondrial outer membrane protein OM14 C-terminal domain-containing protein n=2 Tax=Candida parapsilosis TaxID=5480 RepID=G8B5V9_CANPC|nr:uncharacterized protein CPAR2_109260 [Candida parapsilosis]KAF6043252.1 hypothetical protein FOB59_005335 [Candida parapsilosis]KAF6049170.1 putative integral membrane protein [Candida parapsilosis]KAF6057021.1 putative integral membrane protein [Candida parapsilosis]KAF6066260.1 putative integral membrane protein [Candida parapsilosis]KAI5905544.1 hypothetical protein K4G60_g4804 [Candida parapsilosis]